MKHTQVASDSERYQEALLRLTGQRVLVLGDLMLDAWMWGKVSRISPEAPVPVVDVERTSYTPGGAANVACNLLSLGCQVSVAGVVGQDDSGARLLEALQTQGADVSGIVRSPLRCTTVKTRVIAHSQQVVRVDQEERSLLHSQESRKLEDWWRGHSAKFDGVFLSDYDKGFFTSPVLTRLLPALIAGPTPVVAGPKPNNISLFTGVDCLTLNALEAAQATGLPVVTDDETAEAGRSLLSSTAAASVLVTRGDKGMTFFNKSGESIGESALATEVFDVSGAGDTVLTVLGLGLCAGIDPRCCVKLASHAAAVVVRKLGTATVTVAEIAASLDRRR